MKGKTQYGKDIWINISKADFIKTMDGKQIEIITNGKSEFVNRDSLVECEAAEFVLKEIKKDNEAKPKAPRKKRSSTRQTQPSEL